MFTFLHTDEWIDRQTDMTRLIVANFFSARIKMSYTETYVLKVNEHD